MILYLIKSTLCLTLFYVVYKMVLESENMHFYKRIYLLSSLLFSFIVPFIVFETQTENTVALISKSIQKVVLPVAEIKTPTHYSSSLIFIIYTIITAVLMLRFTIHLYQLHKKLKNAKIIKLKDTKIALVEDLIVPHTFGSIIFVNISDYQNQNIASELFTHEMAHVRQKHTLDVLFIEILKTIFWFNPILIFYKKAIQLNHEFLADETVIVSHQNVSIYQQLLLSKSYIPTNLYLTSNLNSFLKTKKRFIMMTKTTSTNTQWIKKALVAPLFLGLFMFATTTSAQVVTEKEQQTNEVLEQKVNLQEPKSDIYNAVEKRPEFPGGIQAFYDFIGKNYKIPNVKDLKGRVYVQFVVEKDGSLTDIKSVRDIGHGTGEEAVRVLKLSPKWIPGEQDGKPVRVQYSLPISISGN